MADSKATFTIDFGKLIAQLDAAAAKQVQNGYLSINSGIKYPSDKPDENNIGNAVFSFASKDGTYEVAVFKPEFELYGTLPINELSSDMEKVLAKQKGHELEEASIKEQEKLLERLLEMAKGIPAVEDLSKEAGYDELKPNEKWDKVIEAINAYNEGKENSKNSVAARNAPILNEGKKSALEELKRYFTVFLGKKAIGNLTEANIQIGAFKEAPKSISDAYKKYVDIRDGSIRTISVEEARKEMQSQLQRKNDQEDLLVRITLAVKCQYTLETPAA